MPADGQTDRHNEDNIRFSQCCELAQKLLEIFCLRLEDIGLGMHPVGPKA